MDEFEDRPEEGHISHLPTIVYYQKTYAQSLGDNDQKAVKVFTDYESQEKLRRLQSELLWVKKGQAAEKACDNIIGKKRRSKYRGYSKWAEMMLLWIIEANKS